MTSTYRAVLLTRKGGPEALELRELPLEPPGPGQVRVRVRATGVGFTDIIMRRGYYPYAPRFPFTPGYEVVGDVDAIGPGVTGLRVGQRVAALTVHGGCAEFMTRGAEEFIPVPDGLDDAEVTALILNYVTAYQMIHRVARVQRGTRALVTGAGGGVSTALLQLLRVAGAEVFGVDSPPKSEAIRAQGARFIDYKERPFDQTVRELVPEGVDVAFDGIGGGNITLCARAVRKGGQVVSYGFTSAVGRDGSSDNLGTFLGMASLFVGTRLRGRRSAFYGITQLYREDPKPFREDLPRLFELLAERKVEPLIAHRLPLLSGRAGQELLERGGVRGKIVLLRAVPEPS
ncbi:zinc-binding dehydrogenase [Archangium violaceum]|uniref:medium chain dehydrogenase/reductase family protein n=1 Tax=Archangium violaceum TaxID=83451 RepID=UPI00194E08ED|nr:medium chain dehydrogenase/reductase family protein [Archangium violaceum]QRO00465.1 zinc-binding dehydrogenase [Archangium violaceum]